MTWSIEVTAKSPRDAAEVALEIQRDPASLATYFKVEDEEGKTYDINAGDPA